MAGLVPAIHAGRFQLTPARIRSGAAWMPGSRPGMTAERVRLDERYAKPSYRSRHSGFMSRMSRAFQARGQCFMFFSR